MRSGIFAFTLSQCEVEEAQEDDEEQDAEPHDIPVSLLYNETENHKLTLSQTQAHTPSAYTRAYKPYQNQRPVFPNTLILISPALTLGHH